jgi:hypothetical protein
MIVDAVLSSSGGHGSAMAEDSMPTVQYKRPRIVPLAMQFVTCEPPCLASHRASLAVARILAD